ncbi:MAG TPA: sporulation protein [Syntrophomonas sp.]|jgi:stage II sporulation protein D|nr:sporulation protein [Syntrophomonas sp.]
MLSYFRLNDVVIDTIITLCFPVIAAVRLEKLLKKGGIHLPRSKSSNILAIMLLFGLLLALSGCQQAAKKPNQPGQLAPEVQKYSAEPAISLYRSDTGKVQNLQLEQYLKGVVAGEIGPKFPMEALKAQAIIARTNTLALLEYENGTRGKHNTDASDDHTEFQAYDEKAVNDNISKAVEETRGMVLTNNGKFVYALFHSASNGTTASIEEGFPKLAEKAPYLVPVATDGITKAPEKYKAWTVKVPRSTVKEIMGTEAGNLDDISIGQTGPSGRVMTVKADQATVNAVDLREKIGFDKLYSTQISSIKAQGNYIVFTGTGWGHGVGMDQWGASLMAEQGKTARDIVAHYYPQAQMTQIYQ